jgi:transposase-like protein
MEIVSQSGSDKNLAGVIRIEEGKIRSHVDQVVRETVEQTLNGLLQAEADELCGAQRYARSPERLDTRAGHYDRKLQTQAGEVTLSVPRLRNLPFETEIIERYPRRETNAESVGQRNRDSGIAHCGK